MASLGEQLEELQAAVSAAAASLPAAAKAGDGGVRRQVDALQRSLGAWEEQVWVGAGACGVLLTPGNKQQLQRL